jgi:hypothetical protein
MPNRQLNIRLDASARDQLEALAFLRRLPAATLARDLVIEYLARSKDEPGLDTALLALGQHDRTVGTPDATITTIHTK